jgi:hypothetical protein
MPAAVVALAWTQEIALNLRGAGKILFIALDAFTLRNSVGPPTKRSRHD